MNFHHSSGQRHEPEINLVPLIDVMLVIIIFLMMTTTFNKTAGLEISLPTANPDGSKTPVVTAEIIVAVTSTGSIIINGRSVSGSNVDAIAAALANARPAKGPEPVVIINADAQAAHQHVINVMQASQRAGLPRVSFATRQERQR
ncbi:MAG: biopolymer transporter ExbD [Azoarcus sp.]|jgi:biopolymer transport protein ExbD|nr:biopolymer transporter ExbD [Azoarcus sp.]